MSGVVRQLGGMEVQMLVEGETREGKAQVVDVRLSPQGAFALARRLFSAASEIEAPSDPLGWGGRCP